jgi:hypothetical protein
MVGGGIAESGVGHSLQEEVADLQRQVCTFALHDISSMNCSIFTILMANLLLQTLSELFVKV